MSSDEKPLEWVGRSYAELLSFPPDVVHQAGYNLGRVQLGKEPGDWKPMESIGPGACEIRVRSVDGGTVQHRVLYVAKFPEAIYVLHAFEKKTRATSQHNLEVGMARYAQMLRQRPQQVKPGRGGKR